MRMAETAAEKPMGISHALSQYLTMFKADSNQFKTYMAANAVVDWFGRTIRGPAKIQDYLRNEVCSHYEHLNFEHLKCCGPIEYKPTHIKTKTLLSDDVDYTLPINKVSGITSLKLYADSDMEDNDVDMAESFMSHAQPSSTDLLLNSSAAITPPTSTTKVDPDASGTESENEDLSMMSATAAKRRKFSHSPTSTFSYLRRYQCTSFKRKLVNDIGIRALMTASNTDDEDDEEAEVGRKDDRGDYTALKYFEVTGTLRSYMEKVQQQDIDDSTRIVGAAAAAAAAAFPATPPSAAVHWNNRTAVNSDSGDVAGYWDRPVRLRVSFRRRIKDQEVQFALIIYEHPEKASASAMLPKRNLMMQFNRTEPDDDDVGEDEDEGSENEEEASRRMKPPPHEALLQSELLRANEKPMDSDQHLMTTPTKLVHTPPATPTRKPRIPQTLSSSKRFKAHNGTTGGSAAQTAATPSPKRSAARSLRL